MPALERQEKEMKKRFYFVIVVFLFFSKIFAYEIEDFSNCEWFDNISVEYIINYQKPILDKYDIVSFSFPKKNNSVNYKDWGYYRISGIGGVGAIYSVSKKEDNMFVFEYGYYPSSSEAGDKRKLSGTVIKNTETGVGLHISAKNYEEISDCLVNR